MPEPIDPHSVRLAFLTAGQAQWDREWVAQKTVPFSIVAQVTEGRYAIEYDGKTADVNPGEAFYAPANAPLRIVHRLDRRRQVMAARWIHFQFTAMSGVDVLSLYDLPIKLSEQEMEPLGEWFEHLLRPPGTTADGLSVLRWTTRRTWIGWSLLERLCGLGRPHAGAGQALLRTERLAPVLEYVQRHLAEPIDVRRLAREAHLSPSRFHSLFKQQIGQTPLAHVKRVRLDRAGCLLAETDQTLVSIAERVGLRNPFHLSREFKRQFGLSPAAYRKLNRQPAIANNAKGSTG